MKYDTIFWDWNGTIIDDLSVSMQSLNNLLINRGMNTYDTPEDYYGVFCFPIVDYYKKVGFDFDVEPFEKLAVEYIESYDKLSKTCKVFADIEVVLKNMRERGVRQIILSASERGGLIKWLTSLDIIKYFDDIIGNDNIYAVGKADIALNWLDTHAVDLSRAVMVGDTTHDFEVASAMGCDCVLMLRGHNSREDLLTTGAPIFGNGRELAEYLENVK